MQLVIADKVLTYITNLIYFLFRRSIIFGSDFHQKAADAAWCTTKTLWYARGQWFDITIMRAKVIHKAETYPPSHATDCFRPRAIRLDIKHHRKQKRGLIFVDLMLLRPLFFCYHGR